MPSDLAIGPDTTTRGAPTSLSRVGHLLAAAVNAVLLWVSHQLLDWGWPGFLTDEFASVLGLVTASFVASILVNLALVVHDKGRFETFTEVVTAAFALAVGLRLLEVFPFDWSGYPIDWSGPTHGLLVLLIAATGIALVANLLRLVATPTED